MKSIPITLPMLALLSGLSSSCVSHITYKDEPRQRIRFGNAQAAQTFYECLFLPDGPKRHGAVSVGVPLPYGHRTISTENTRFNAAIQKADSNHDKIISESEARAFAAKQSAEKPHYRWNEPGNPATFTEI